MKTKQQLIDEKVNAYQTPKEQVEVIESSAYVEGIERAFKEFKARLESYKRYRHRPDLLLVEQKDIYDKMEKEIRKDNITSSVLYEIEGWVFNYYFKGAME